MGDDNLSLDGRVAVVTGAGAGLGRAEAVALGRAGARVVLNDLPGAADDAADELKGLGAEVAIVEGDVGERSTADAMLAAAVEGFGQLDIVVNNAGMTRDRMLFNLSDEEWDDVIRVHLRGHFLLSRNAASYWRQQSKAADAPVYGRIVNTASEAFLGGSPGQANYAAAKAGIAALTLSSARGLGKIGVRANAICPRARTAMTAQVFGEDTSGRGGRPLLARPRGPAGRLPRLARRRPDHRPGLRGLRRDGGPGRRTGGRAAFRRLRLGLGPARPRPAARRVLLRARSLGRLRRRLDHAIGSLMGRLDGKVAIVTGGAMGQGAGIVRAYVAEGASVVVADVAKEPGQVLADELGPTAHFVDHDVSDPAAWATLVADANERFGPVNVLANNAGILRFGTVESMPVDEVELLWRVNQLGCWLGMQAVVPTMKANGGGSIINASSTEGLGGMANTVAYGATKFAIRGMTKGASHELGPFNIRVNSVHPGMIDTPMTRVHGGDLAMEYGAKKVPLRRVGHPEDVAPLYVFLGSDESSYINGAEIAIDGGVTATHAFGG